MKDIELKVGDNVTIRGWDDMASEFGVIDDVEINCMFGFYDGMKKYCGGKYNITNIEVEKEMNGLNYNVYYLDIPGKEFYSFSTDMFVECKGE